VASKYAVNTDHLFLRLPDRTLGVYNAWDSYQTARLVKPLLEEVESNGNLDYYTRVVEPLQYAVLNMQRRGLLLDQPALARYRDTVRRELQLSDHIILQCDPTGELRAPTGKSSNSIGSTQKLGRFLFDTLGFKSPKPTPKGKRSTDQEALYKILQGMRKKDEPHREVLEQLFHRSRLKTILQRYLTVEPDHDGRVRAKVKMAGTKTMRFAYAEPALQQFPPEARHMFKAGRGNRFLQVDYSQLEARLLAYLSGDRASVGVFESGGDVHQQNGADLLGVELGDVTKSGRNLAKTFLYGISYGGSAETLKLKLYCPCPKCIESMPDTLHLKRTEMKQAEIRWFRKHSAVRTFQTATANFIRRHHYYQSPLGARRYLAKPWGHELEREVKNLPMQFGGALLMNRKQVRLDRRGAPIVLQMHDSFLLEVPEDEVDRWARTAQAVMETPIPELGGISIPVDIEVGENWGELRTWKAELGDTTLKTANRSSSNTTVETTKTTSGKQQRPTLSG